MFQYPLKINVSLNLCFILNTINNVNPQIKLKFGSIPHLILLLFIRYDLLLTGLIILGVNWKNYWSSMARERIKISKIAKRRVSHVEGKYFLLGLKFLTMRRAGPDIIFKIWNRTTHLAISTENRRKTHLLVVHFNFMLY